MVASVAALVTVAGGVAVASVLAAQREAIAEAKVLTRFAARTVLEPNLRNGIRSGDQADIDHLDRVVHGSLLGDPILRVKLWTPQGRIVYSDDPRLIGSVFPLSADEKHTIREDGIEAEVSDLADPENRFERSESKLLEVYLPVRTPDGRALLFETYLRYGDVNDRTRDIILMFGTITLGGMLVFAGLLVPLVRSLVVRLDQDRAHREMLLTAAALASADERRRIAADLHDGVVQSLAGASYVVAGAAQSASALDETALAGRLRNAAAGIRDAIRGVRSFVIDIYPPNLREQGIAAALEDLAVRARSKGLDTSVTVPADFHASPRAEALIYRVTQEAVRNVIAHAGAQRLVVHVPVEPNLAVVEVTDDGAGFDPAAPPHGGDPEHMGLRGLADMVREAGGLLLLRTAPGAGTTLRLEVPFE